MVGAILAHPALYRHLDAPTWSSRRWCSSPGALRSAGQGIERDAWTWLLSGMGQCPFRPPSVAGWDWGTRWLSSNSMRVRFDVANYLIDTPRVARGGRLHADRPVPRQARRPRPPRGRRPLDLARDRPRAAAHGAPAAARPELADGDWRQPEQQRADMCQRVLRHLLSSGPDAQVH